MQVTLSEIFVHNVHQQRFSKEALLNLDIKTEFVERLARYLGLGHIENETTESNLCYAFETNINPDYKVVLSKSDIKSYLEKALEPIEYHLESDTIKFPKSLNP
ncbi:MAG: hypothetical protein CMH46_15600 [Muricauda sp.]|nr:MULTISPECIES: hypothetical protein [unclassified Allomuricauda]MAU16952.1 hypothetical protein [Allomuricauda sp.]|tara:strand:+ start:2870 stop:3181 length:312 start_codon:yes stop_codon:yes gene_type:complete